MTAFGRNGSWPQHVPQGDPCKRCGQPALKHRNMMHAPRLDDFGMCDRCDLPETNHRRDRRRRDKGKRIRDQRVIHEPIVFLDGEGMGSKPHRYTYLAAVDEHGEVIGEIEHPAGLPTYSILEFLLSLGIKRCYGFSLGYDLTKWLQDMPERAIYDLVRPERRRAVSRNGKPYQRRVYWGFNRTTGKPGFQLDYLRAKITVRRAAFNGRHYQGFGPILTIWDVWRFFASKFTTALIDWQVADKDKLERMLRMKEERPDFQELTHEIRDYCKEECLYGAKLVRALIEAHEDVGLRLKSFYGAGSTATSLLTVMSAKSYQADPPEALKDAIACAFFGGRFETSRVGPIREPVYNYDISSAYPYQTTFLPCLQCGTWEPLAPRNAHRVICNAALALVNVQAKANGPWGAFPHRLKEGSILFPLQTHNTWVWKPEYLAARRHHKVTVLSGWVYHSNCNHRPFARLPDYYLERIRLGKDAKGIVLKLGYNSCYGKFAQSVGKAPFQSWVWAGNITAGTRAQLLDAIALAKDPWSVLMTATDGVFSLEPLKLPAPLDTGTDACGKPLGGWEEKVYPRGIFLLRPGIYFPIDPTDEDRKAIRARGMSKDVLLRNADAILDHWKKNGPWQDYKVLGLKRFVGVRTGVQVYKEAEGPCRSRDYGEWIDYPIDLSFDPFPKREKIYKDMRLKPWAKVEGPSMPYRKGALSNDAKALKEAEAILSDQADGDFIDSSEVGLA